MATLTAVNPRVARGTHLATVSKLVQNGTTWNTGQFLNESGTGLVAVGDNPTDIKYFALSDQADPGNTTTYAKVGIITAQSEFIMNELDGTVADANVGEGYNVDVTNGVCTVDFGMTNAKAVVVTSLHADDEPMLNSNSDTKARVKVRVIQSVLDA